MPQLETAFLGVITLRLLHDLPVEAAGWLIHALAVWILDDSEPELSTIPTECVGAWIAIREESINIHEARKSRSDTKRSAALARWNADGCRRMQSDADECRSMQTDATRAPAKTKTKTKTEISSDVRCPDVARERASRPSSVGVGLRSSVDSSIRIPSPSENFVVWAKLQDDPVDVALCATGETDKRARRTYGAQLKRLGRERFVDLVCDFHSTLADEPPRNKGATLTAFLRDTP